MSARTPRVSTWKAPLHVWLKSEYIDNSNFSRFGAAPAVFEQPSWPLGLRRLSNGSGHISNEAAFEIVDTGFDYDVSCAWQLPLRYSRLKLGVRDFEPKGQLNWLIRNVGRWDRDEDRFRQLQWTLNDANSISEHREVQAGYALTPFCIITQHWIGSEDDKSQAIPIFCDILLFYTFETFLQECLALEARRNGVAKSDIFGAYEHIYCNSRTRPELIPSVPAEYELSRLAQTRVNWRDILNVRQDASDAALLQDTRLKLFISRRQCHLMAAIGAACIGIPTFLSSRASSKLVQVSERRFSATELAPHWLAHMVGDLNYAAECEDLFVGLAGHYGNAVTRNSRGVPEPPLWNAGTLVEEYVASQRPPVLLTREEPEAFGRYAWGSFEASFDDQSLRDWQQQLEALAKRGD